MIKSQLPALLAQETAAGVGERGTKRTIGVLIGLKSLILQLLLVGRPEIEVQNSLALDIPAATMRMIDEIKPTRDEPTLDLPVYGTGAGVTF